MVGEGADYVIVGAGSAGCVLADRLSADGKSRVVLIEAGGDDRFWRNPGQLISNLNILVPAGFTRVLHDPRINWNYKTEPDPGTESGRIRIRLWNRFGRCRGGQGGGDESEDGKCRQEEMGVHGCLGVATEKHRGDCFLDKIPGRESTIVLCEVVGSKWGLAEEVVFALRVEERGGVDEVRVGGAERGAVAEDEVVFAVVEVVPPDAMARTQARGEDENFTSTRGPHTESPD